MDNIAVTMQQHVDMVDVHHRYRAQVREEYGDDNRYRKLPKKRNSLKAAEVCPENNGSNKEGIWARRFPEVTTPRPRLRKALLDNRAQYLPNHDIQHAVSAERYTRWVSNQEVCGNQRDVLHRSDVQPSCDNNINT